MTSNLTSADAPPDVVERVREAQRLRYAEEETRIARELQAVKDRSRSERAVLIPADVEQLLREYRQAHRPPDGATVTEEERQRLGNEVRAFAMSLGVDVPAVCRMQADSEAAYTAVLQPRQTGEVQVSEWSPLTSQVATNQTFDGWWDVGQSFSTTRPSHTSIWNAQFAILSYPSVVLGMAPRSLPHAEPAPWPGHSWR